MEVDNLLADAEKLTGGKVTVEGVCTHICRHGGRKIFLMGTDDTQVIRIEAGEKIGSFKPECVNNVVRVTGTLVEDRIDEAYLAEWGCGSRTRSPGSTARAKPDAAPNIRPAANRLPAAPKSVSPTSVPVSPTAKPKKARNTFRSTMWTAGVMKF